MNVLKKYFESTNQHRQHVLTENHNYKEGPILQFWYIVDQDSPGVKKFVRGLWMNAFQVNAKIPTR